MEEDDVKKVATWTYIRVNGHWIPFELRAGRKACGHLLGGLWEAAFDGQSLEEKITALTARASALGYAVVPPHNETACA